MSENLGKISQYTSNVNVDYALALIGKHIETEFKVKLVEPICLVGAAAELAELAVYNAKKLYLGVEVDGVGAVTFADSTNTNFAYQYSNKNTRGIEWDGNLTATVQETGTDADQNCHTIKNIYFATASSVVKFIGFRITLE